MRAKFLMIGIVYLFASCAHSKLATVTSENSASTEKGFIFENDTVKITYRFWGNKGVMNFDVYNKLNTPIFIDLKNSAYIPNDKMISYWKDITNTETVFAGSSYYLSYGGAVSSGKSKSKAVRKDRITTISPHSIVTNKTYSLITSFSDLSGKGAYNKESSPLIFRNYLSISLNEKFEGQITYVDNSFYVSDIKSVKSAKINDYKTLTAFYVLSK